LLRRHVPAAFAPAVPLLVDPEGACPPWVVLIENHSSESHAHAEQRLQALLQMAADQAWIQQAVLAANESQCRAIWQLREAIPLAERQEGLMVKHDIGLPTSRIPEFVSAAGQAIHARWPAARVVCFGHLGDGNLHYNVQPPADQRQGDALLNFELAVNAVVFDQVCALGGTISAEHGVGALRQAELARRKSPVALHMMHAIKQALDPQGIMNPGRMLSL
jgi:FAD/FMN-containing dehydrogenase